VRVTDDRGEDSPTRKFIAKITSTLRQNMSQAGDFSFEAIQSLGNPIPMLVVNSGSELLELWLEPFGQDYWLRPGESVIVTSYGQWDDHPFETAHEPNLITVWATSFFATVSDRNGREVPGAWQRPKGKYGS
jgi:hypothetical protein